MSIVTIPNISNESIVSSDATKSTLISAELQCGICLNNYEKPVMLSCGHSFCDCCTVEWLRQRSTCPVCRSPTLRPVRNIALQQIVDDHRRLQTKSDHSHKNTFISTFIRGCNRSINAQAIAISNADIRASRRSVRRFNQSSKNTTSNSIDNVLETPINVSMTTDNNATIIGTLPQFIRTKSTNKLSSSIANSNHQQQQSIDTNQIDQSTTKQSFHRGTQLRTSIARIRKTIRSATSARNVISSDDNVMINSVSTHRRDEYKIVLVGAAGVGKTSLASWFHPPMILSHQLTDSINRMRQRHIDDNYTTQMDIDGKNYVLDIMDTSGTDQFTAMRDLYMKNGDGFILMYSIVDQSSIKALVDIHRQIIRNKDTKNVPMIIVGNKCDLDNDRIISVEQGERMSRLFSNNCTFIETSATRDINVQMALQSLVRQILDAHRNVDVTVDVGEQRRKHLACSLM